MRLTYGDIKDLPTDHPDSIRFMKELQEQEDAYKGYTTGSGLDDEESLEYFNRYIAGDR